MSTHDDTAGREPEQVGTPRLVVAWALVGVPLAYGVYRTLVSAAQLFTG